MNKLTPEKLEELKEEGRQLSKELDKQIRQMWNIPEEQMKRRCNCGKCC